MTKKLVNIWVYYIDIDQKRIIPKPDGEAENALESRRVKKHMRRQQKNQLEPQCVAVVRHIFSDVRSNMDMERYGYATNLTSRPARSHMHSVYRLDPHVFGSPKTDFDLSDQAMRTSVSVWDCNSLRPFQIGLLWRIVGCVGISLRQSRKGLVRA